MGTVHQPAYLRTLTSCLLAYSLLATQENAKAVSRKLLLRLHPDKCQLPAAAEAWTEA